MKNNYLLWYYQTVKNKVFNTYISKIGIEYYYNKTRRYGGRKVLTVNDINLALKKAILSKKPFMTARFGSTELFNMRVFDCAISNKYEKAVKQLCENAGFFPNSIDLAREFVKEMKLSCSNIDFLAIWTITMEDYYIRKYTKNNMLMTRLRYLEPWYSEDPWTTALKDKKVLIIHPFAATIKSQYKNRTKLFLNQKVLPEFDIYVLKAVQTIADEKDPRFDTWFNALEYMYEEAMGIDFDIALIGCGAYGFPLASKLKNAGKQAIHMGGVLQILFGIKGKRWDDDNNSIVSSLYNDNWVRPFEEDIPSGHNKVEEGCYW